MTRITEHVSDRSKVDGVHIDVDIEVDQIGGSSQRALEAVERLETAVKEEISAMHEDDVAGDFGGDSGA